MKKLKKFLLFIACCLTACAIAIPFAACAEDPDAGGDGGNDGNEQGSGDNTGEETQSGTNVLQSISINELDAKRQFNIGESFSSEGLTVTALITNLGGTGGSQNPDVTDKAVIDSSAFDSSKPGTYPIYISYTFGGITLYASYNVTVVSAIEGTIAGLEVSFSGERQYSLVAANSETVPAIDLSKLTVTQVVGADANNTTETALTRSQYELSYSVDGGEAVAVPESQTTIPVTQKGVYSVYASATYTSGGESFEMNGFVAVYAVDPVVSLVYNNDGTKEFDYDTDETIGSDWTYTVSYNSGATAKVGYSDVTLEGIVNDNEGQNSATVTYVEEQLGYSSETQDAVIASYTESCSVNYTIGENPNTGSYEETITVNITDLAIANSDSITESIDLSGDGKIMATASSSGEIRINDNSKSIDGFSFTRRLQLRGAGSAEARSIKLTLDGAAEITVYGMSATGGSVRTLSLYDADFANATQGQSNDGTAIQKFTYTTDAAGTYYLAGDNGINIYYISVVQTIVSDTPAPEDVAVNITDLAIANSNSITESIDLSGDGKIMATASSSGEIRINDNSKSIDGFSFTRRLQLRGAGSAEARSIKLTVEAPATIIVYGMSATGGSIRTLSLYDADFANASQGQSNDGTAIQKFTYTIEAAGTYYLAGDNGINIYYIAITY